METLVHHFCVVGQFKVSLSLLYSGVTRNTCLLPKKSCIRVDLCSALLVINIADNISSSSGEIIPHTKPSDVK